MAENLMHMATTLSTYVKERETNRKELAEKYGVNKELIIAEVAVEKLAKNSLHNSSLT